MKPKIYMHFMTGSLADQCEWEAGISQSNKEDDKWIEESGMTPETFEQNIKDGNLIEVEFNGEWVEVTA